MSKSGSKDGRSAGRSALHAIERVFDAFRARPLGMIVFAASAGLLLYLQVVSQGAIRAEAVAQAPRVSQPARVASFVTEVYVRAGDRVHEGTPLVALSAHFIDRELAQLDAEVERLMHEARLASARLLVEEQRWLDPQVRLRPDRPSLEDPTQALYAKELAVLHTRRRQLFDDRSTLTVKSSSAGRVAYVLPLGTAVAAGGPVATLVAELAEEIVAYVPASTRPDSIEVGAVVRISRPTGVCG